MPNYSKKIVYLSKAQYQELITNNSVTVNGVTVTYNENDIYITPQAEPITDVKINNTSIGNNGMANIPIANSSTLGVSKINNSYGIDISVNGELTIKSAGNYSLKTGQNSFNPITPDKQHLSVFYGLATAAGDSSQSSSTNEVGIYTDAAKGAIQNMLGITDLIGVEESTTATAAHSQNSIFLMGGKLYKATTNIIIGDAVASGTNCEVVKIDEIFTKNTDLMVIPGTGIGSLKIKDFSSSTKTYSATASGMASIAFGAGCIASGNATMAVGNYTTASGGFSFAAGYRTIASGIHSIAFGNATEASGHHSGTIGYLTRATGPDSFVFGTYNVEDNWNSWPEWVANTTYAVGDKVKRTTVSNNTTTVQGYICITANSDASFTTSKWYEGRMNYVQIVGNGLTTRSNAYALDWEGNGHYGGYVYVGCNSDSTGGIRLPHDIQINGNSIVSNGIATIPVRGNIVSGSNDLVTSNAVNSALTVMFGTTSTQIKEGTHTFRALTPAKQHEVTFYGLAKAAGDTTQSSSDNAVGTYTDGAKTAIQTMLGVEPGVTLIETVSGTTPTITALPNVRYNCGEVSTISITPPANGTCDVFFTSGSTAAVLTVPNTVKWPAWFDATTLEADMIYEIMITDGVYGSVMTWES